MNLKNIQEVTTECTDFEQVSFNAENIPSEMKEYDQWLLWKLEPQPKGKPKKVPYTTSGYKASSTNPETWSSFEEAFETYQQNEDTYCGLGFVFSEEDPFIGIDWDKSRDFTTGEFDPQIVEEVITVCSYAEVSQSGNGFHSIAIGTLPGTRKKANDREMYTSKRFFAITGNHVKNTPCTVNKAPEEAIRAIYDRMIESVEEASKNEKLVNEQSLEPKRIRSPESLTFGVLEKCRRGKSSERFNTLYVGNWDSLECYPSQSEADLALCSMFAAHTQDRSQIERLFAGSGLCSDKWNRTDYKERTINKSLERINEDPYRKYFSEGKFIAKLLADEVMAEYHFLTFDDTKEVYYYENGVYQPEERTL